MERKFYYDVDQLIEHLGELKKPVKDGFEIDGGGVGIYVRLGGKQYRLTSANKDEVDHDGTGVVLGLTLDERKGDGESKGD